MHHNTTITLAVIILLLITGCSGKEDIPDLHVNTAPLMTGEKNIEDHSWWRVRFRISWPEETDVDSGMDLLLAHGVIRTVLIENRELIAYWRFHRRASRDAAGHQFSFTFYATGETAETIFTDIQEKRLLAQAQEAQLIKKIIYDDPSQPTGLNIEETSDKHWHKALQKNWPAYIMGVSALWLGLIDDLHTGELESSEDIKKTLEEYRKTHERISEIWFDEGQHALFHHINAIFGYEPLMIKKRMIF